VVNNNKIFVEKEYGLRFDHIVEYRNKVWKILTKGFFQALIPKEASLLDLGVGYGEFINNIEANEKFAMDLNPRAKNFLNKDVVFINQNCAEKWPVAENSLDAIFSSNFFEHLESKGQVQLVIEQAYRGLKPNGMLVLVGPNIKHTKGRYWDVWGHHVPMTEKSVSELLKIYNFKIVKCIPKFLPYAMGSTRPLPLFFLPWYLKAPFLWKILGKQFLIVAKK